MTGIPADCVERSVERYTANCVIDNVESLTVGECADVFFNGAGTVVYGRRTEALHKFLLTR